MSQRWFPHTFRKSIFSRLQLFPVAHSFWGVRIEFMNCVIKRNSKHLGKILKDIKAFVFASFEKSDFWTFQLLPVGHSFWTNSELGNQKKFKSLGEFLNYVKAFVSAHFQKSDEIAISTSSGPSFWSVHIDFLHREIKRK